jgi:PAS domain S-box-containing protein
MTNGCEDDKNRSEMQLLRRSQDAVKPYVIAIVAVAGATMVRLALEALVQSRGAYIFFTFGVVIAALYGGLRAGVAATILSLPLCDYLFIEPRYTWFIHDARGDSILLVLFIILGAGVSVIVARFQRAKERLRESAAALEESEHRLRALAAAVPQILFTAEPDGSVDYVSRRFSDYTGLEPVSLPGSGWLQALHPEDRYAATAGWTKPIETGNDYQASFRLKRSDGLYRWFESHATSIRDSKGQLTKWFGVCSDVHDHKTLEEALERRTEELLEANDDLQRFTYRVSHDVKEPLRIVGIYTEMLVQRNQEKLDEESCLFARHIRKGVDRITNQITDLLKYAQEGQSEPPRTTVDLNAIVDSVAAHVQPAAAMAGATVTHDPLPPVVANGDAIVSVFQNLIGNALKYRSAAPPRVHISVRAADDDWEFLVQDNGIGFEMKDAEQIFDVFYRLHSNSQIEGTGLGLAIVKRIINRSGGRVWAESCPGKGSIFHFTLPKTASVTSQTGQT